MNHQMNDSHHLPDNSLKNTIRNSILILVFEFVGTFFLTLLYLSQAGNNLVINNQSSYFSKGSVFSSQDISGFLVGFFILLIFGAKVSGSHYNPAVTFAFMIRRDTGRFSRTLGIAYIIFQFIAAFLGAIIAYCFNGYDPVKFGIEDKKNVGYGMASEVLGTFFLCFLYLTQTESKTKLSQDPAITTLIISASYIAALIMVSGPHDFLACLNPAVAFGAMMQQAYDGNGQGWSRSYIYIPFPFIGAAIAVFFHELVYKKVQETIKESEEIDGILDKNDD